MLRLVVRAQKENGQDLDVWDTAKDVGNTVGGALDVISLCKPEGSRLVLLPDELDNLTASVLQAIAMAIQARLSYEIG